MQNSDKAFAKRVLSDTAPKSQQGILTMRIHDGSIPQMSRSGCRKGKGVSAGWRQEGHPSRKTSHQNPLIGKSRGNPYEAEALGRPWPAHFWPLLAANIPGPPTLSTSVHLRPHVSLSSENIVKYFIMLPQRSALDFR